MKRIRLKLKRALTSMLLKSSSSPIVRLNNDFRKVYRVLKERERERDSLMVNA